MTAAEAREQASKSENQLPLESYMKWVNGRIANRVKDGKLFTSPVFEGISVLPKPNTCEKIAELLKQDGYKVEFDSNGILVKIDWSC